MMRIVRRLHRYSVAALLAGFAWGVALGHAAPPTPYLSQSRATSEAFTSGGARIDVDWFHAPTPGRHAAILLLHGSGGFDGAPYAETADRLAARGFDVFIVHYFERTGIVHADGQPFGATETRYFSTWQRTISDAVGWVAGRPSVDGHHIGLLGVSLGASLALATAAQDHRVKAVVDYYGMLYQEVAAKTKAMPPVLILHGDEDPIVPLSAATYLEGFLTASHVPFEARIYRGHGHGFWGEAEVDADNRTAAFFGRWLGAAAPRRASVKPSPAPMG